MTKTASVGEDGGIRRSRRGRSRRHNHAPVVRDDMGKWIWISEPDDSRNSFVYARKLFELSRKPTQATLKASSDARYKVFVNGEYVGKGPVRSCSGYSYYDTYDITAHLTKGKNVIAFLVHHIGDPTNYAALKQPGLVCKAEIALEDEAVMVVSDETWQMHLADDWTNQGTRITEALGYQEVYDAGQRLEGWNEVKFKGKGWQDAVVVGTVPSMPWGDLVGREIPQLAEEKIYPRMITGLYNSPERSKDTPPAEVPAIMADSELAELKSGSVKCFDALYSAEELTKVSTPRSDAGVVMILDFGREVFGNVEIGVSGSGTGVIDIGYSEILEDGRVKPNRAGYKYTDRVILKKGRLDWQGFEPRAFRYMQVEFRRCSKAVALEYIRVNQTLYPVRTTGSFECSDSLLNDVWRIGTQTTHLCMEDSYIDSPWRERALWWGDARVQSRAAYYAFDDTALLAQGLRQIASQQAADGSIPGMYPGGSDKLVPDYALYWVYSILDYYAFADDAGLVRDLYPNVERLLGWFQKHTDANGLLADVPGWLFIDWAEMEKRGEVTSLNCLFYHALRVAAMLAAILDREDDHNGYLEAAAKLRLAINKYLYSARQGLYAECRAGGVLVDKFSRQTNILAALFDVPDHYRKASILRVLVGPSLPELETTYFTSYLVEVLCAGERHVDALHVMRKKWGEMVKAGAATFWESFSGDGSRCHGWSAGPVRDLIAEFVGIKPVIGSHRFSVSPHTGDLKWARGTVNTKVGLLAVEWKIIRGALSIAVDVPQGIKVDVYPPCPAGCKITVDGKAYASQFVTLSGGSHVVRLVVAKAPKQVPLDKSLEPKPIPHVEILGEAMQRGRRRLSVTSTRRRSGSRREDESVVDSGIIEIEGYETRPEPIEEFEPEVVSKETEEAGPASRRKRSRRGGKGRSRGREAVDQVESAPVETPEHVEEAVPAEVEPVVGDETAEAPGKSRRRRSRRGGRRRGGAEAQEPVEQAAEQTAEPVEAVVEQSQPVEPVVAEEAQAAGEEPHKSRRRRSRRGGRGRSRGAEHAEAVESGEVSAEPEAVVQEAAPEPVGELEAVSEAAEPSRPRRRRSRGGRRHRSEAASAEIGEVHAEQPEQPHVEPEPAAVVAPEPAVGLVEETRRPSRRRSRRAPKTDVPAAGPVEPVAEVALVHVVEPKPEPVAPEPVVAAEETAKKRRPRRPSRKAPVSEAVAEVPVAVEVQPEPVSAVVPDAPAGEEPKKKRRTYTRRPRKSAEGEGTVPGS